MKQLGMIGDSFLVVFLGLIQVATSPGRTLFRRNAQSSKQRHQTFLPWPISLS